MSILGIGPVCALGSGANRLLEGLQGTRAPAVIRRERTFRGKVYRLPVYEPVMEGMDRFFPQRELRRVDDFSKAALLSACLAAEDAGSAFPDRTRVGVVFGSAYGPLKTTFRFLDGLIDEGDAFASPQHFAASVHNAPASQISCSLKIKGPCSTVTAFRHSTAAVLLTAGEWLAEGTVDYVLAGFGDELCDVLEYAALGWGSGQASAIAPLDLESCSFIPGAGAVFFVLGPESLPSPYGKISFQTRLDTGAMPSGSFSAHSAVILSAKGIAEENKPLRTLDLAGVPVAAYSSLYGGIPLSAGFDMAAAALSLKEKRLFPVPSPAAPSHLFRTLTEPEALRPGASLCVLEPVEEDELNLYTISHEDT